MITAEQIRAARALLNWKQSELADKTGLSLPSINNIERNIGSPRLSTLNTIRDTLQAAGIEFISTNGVQKQSEFFEMREYQGDDFVAHLNDDLFLCMRNHMDEVLMYGLDESLYPKYSPDQVMRYDDYQKKTGFRQRILVKEGDDFFVTNTDCYRWIAPEMLGVIPYYVYHDRLAMTIFESKRTIIIRSQTIADTFRAQFEFLWAMSKPVPKISKNKLDDPKFRANFEKSNKKAGK